jgi:hypothetical protein
LLQVLTQMLERRLSAGDPLRKEGVDDQRDD